MSQKCKHEHSDILHSQKPTCLTPPSHNAFEAKCLCFNRLLETANDVSSANCPSPTALVDDGRHYVGLGHLVPDIHPQGELMPFDWKLFLSLSASSCALTHASFQRVARDVTRLPHSPS